MQSNERAGMLYDGIYTLGMRVGGALAAAALGILTARMLGPEGRGVYALPMVQAGLIAAAFSGLSGATSFYLLNGSSGRASVRVALVAACPFVIVGSAAIVLLAVIGHALWAAGPAIASLPATAIINVAGGYALGVKRVRAVTTIAVVTTSINLLAVIIAFIFVARSAWVVIVAWIVSAYIVAGISGLAVFIHSRRYPNGRVPRTGEYLKFALKVGGDNLVTLLNYRGDLYIVAIMSSASALGIYTLAISAAETLLIATQSAALAVSPHIGALDRPAAAVLTARCVRNNMLVAVALCGIIFIAAPMLVAALYGARFLPLIPALRVLLVGVVALSLGSPVASYFTLKLGRPEIQLGLSGLSAVICITLAVLIVPMFGIVGAAVASTVAYLVGQSLGLFMFARAARIRLRAILLPTISDAAFYIRSARQVLNDSRRVLFGGRSA